MSTADISSTRSPTPSNDRETFEDDAQAGAAASNAIVSQENSNFTIDTIQQPPPEITRTGAGAVAFTPGSSSSRVSPSSKKPRKLADTARSILKRLTQTQQEPETPTSTTAASTSSSSDSLSSAASSTRPRERAFQDLKKEQEGVVLNTDGPPLFPRRNDFPGLSLKIFEPIIDVEVKSCVIILPDHSKAESSLHSLALRLQKELPESAFILLRALQPSSSDKNGRKHANQPEPRDDGVETGFLMESRTILVDVIRNGLIAKCRFLPRNIIILGRCQGGTAALTAAASWKEIEFGGVISVGGFMPAFTPQTSTIKAKTPALILSGALGNINDTALRQIEEHFKYVEPDIRRSSNDDIPEAEDIGILLDFFAYRFRGEEWTKQAVISFDGGGIRGYGSLLILRALMDKIGEEEKGLDPNVKSSFAPYDYKPIPKKTCGALDNSEVDDDVVATATQGLPNSSLFLPCHYFTYAAGTSTRGLISIMLSRFRMTVDDCIKEYKTLGAKVFGNPRPLAKGAILWHKFDYRTLEAAIQDVTQRYSEPGDFGGFYAMDEDVCRTIVLAIADNVKADFTYRFRTYKTHVPLQRSKSRGRYSTTGTYGDAAPLPIWQIARATSAAPTYFPPIKIPKGNLPGVVTFKDGGFGFNNPSEEAYFDIIDKHGGSEQNMGPFISIGTGIPPMTYFSKKKGNINNAITNLKVALKSPSRTVGVDQRMEQRSMHDKEGFPYFRFDGGERLGEIALDEWKGNRFTRLTGKDKTSGCRTLDDMWVATAAYLAEPSVQEDLTECARILVRRRQRRMRDSSEWDRYASFSYYDCNVKGCARQLTNKAQDLREHFQKFHPKIADQEMEQRLQECRRVYWKYRPNSPDPTPVSGNKSRRRT